MNTGSAELNLSLILSKRSASKDSGRRAGPCVLRRARSARLLRMREAEHERCLGRGLNLSLILSKRSASKDGRATGQRGRASFDALPAVACSG